MNETQSLESTSETESYLSRNETDSDSDSLLFLLIKQSQMNKKMYLMEVRVKSR